MNSAWNKRVLFQSVGQGGEKTQMMIGWKEKGQGRNQGRDAIEGTRHGFYCSELEQDESSSPKRSWDTFHNSSPPSASRLPEAGAGPQFAGRNIVRGRWHLWNELILDEFRWLCAPFIRSTHHSPVLQIGNGGKKESLFYHSEGQLFWKLCSIVAIVWVIIEQYSFSLLLWAKYMSLLHRCWAWLHNSFWPVEWLEALNASAHLA